MIPAQTILNSRYRIIQQLSAGGMGAIYQAVDENLNCIVAVKEAFAGKDEHRRAFKREAQLLANLTHPALPRVMDHFTHDNGQFLVMQFIPGHDLAELLSMSEGPFALDKVLEWADYLLDALEELHSYNPPIVHRDIKPSNLKLTPKGKIILLDFGLAKGTIGQMSTADAGSSAKSIYGYTRHYAPFEQITDAGTDPRSDLYSLAATLWSLLTGELPPDALARAGAREEGEPDPLRPAHEKNADVPPEIAAVLHQAMSLNRSQRPASAAEMRSMLREAAQAHFQEVRERQRAEEERLAAEAQRKAEEERQRREAEEKRRAEEEETERRLAAEKEAARLAAEERRREEEERERKEAEERQRREAEEAERRRLEEETLRAEAEAQKRAEQEAERLRVEAEQEAERHRLEEQKQARAEEEEQLRREAERAKRQRASEQAVQASREEKQTEPRNRFAAANKTIPASGPVTQPNYSRAHAAIAGAAKPREGKNRRAILLAIIASFLILSTATLIWMRQASEGEQPPVSQNAKPTNMNQSEVTANTQPADQTATEVPTETATSVPSPTATPTPTPLKEEDKQKEESEVSNNNTQTAQAKPQKKNITPLRSGDTADGSRITITSDAPLNDYSAYRSGNRYYVVIPNANAPRTARGLRGRGFEDVQVQKRGNDAILSFKLQPGTNARVSQSFNRLDVEVTPPKN